MIFLTLWIFSIIQRVVELFHSYRNRRKLTAEGFRDREPRLHYLHMVLMHLLWFVSMALEHFYFKSELPQVICFFAAAIFILAQFIRYWAISSLGKHWNTCVMSPDRGDYNSFVAVGPYRFIRHPNYLAVILEFASLPLVASAPISAFLFSLWNALVLVKRIKVEEEYLNSREGYLEKLGDKARFIPGIF